MGLSLATRFRARGGALRGRGWVTRSKTFVKFGMVGFTGTIIDFVIYNLCISGLGFLPALAKAISTMVAILNNFTWNNRWTFRHRRTTSSVWQRLGLFQLVSLGGLAAGGVMVQVLHATYGDGSVHFLFLDVAYYNLYFLATIPVVMIWNFLMNHHFTWKHARA